MKFPFRKNRLRRAIERGLTSNTLAETLEDLGEQEIKSRGDAEAICWGLDHLTSNLGEEHSEQTYLLAQLFQDVPDADCDAFEVLQSEGSPKLIELFDQIKLSGKDEEADCLLFILKVLALYGTTEGTLKVIEAASEPLKPDGYMWSPILGNYGAGHPQNELLYGSLSEPVPEQFIGVSLLDAANAAMIGEESMRHPFDTSSGIERLKSWLSNDHPEEYSYAHSATVALPFVSAPQQSQLLELALKHHDTRIRIEAAWASAKMGHEDGLEKLTQYCDDYRTADIAKQYLEELGKSDRIPESANAPEFAALSEFAQWLAHPNELGRAPDELEIVDHRQLVWPPNTDPLPLWLIKYTAKATEEEEEDDAGVGLVGSITWCFFSEDLVNSPPEDAYGLHCYWELQHHGLIDENDIEEDNSDYDSLLEQWKGSPLTDARIRVLTEISPDLNYPERLVALASAEMEGNQGVVVLDGERTRWYQHPFDENGQLSLKTHIGRYLLGLGTP